jgi:type VI secretion system secreted protein Hcp
MAFNAYMSVKGKNQGQFKGESDKGARSDKWTEVLGFQMQSLRPVDAGSGKPTGARTHKPIVISKQFGAASPQLLSAHWSGEVLDEVVIEIVGGPGKGKGADEPVAQRITLTNATISSVERFSGGVKKPEAPSSKYLEQYSFSYAKVDIGTFK